MKRTIKTYCYRKLHEFPSIKKALAFYLDGINSSEGPERDRYTDIYTKLLLRDAPYCDWEGVPKDEIIAPLSEAEIADAKQIIQQKFLLAEKYDNLRLEFSRLEEEFHKKHHDLLEAIKKTHNEWSNLTNKINSYEARGFRA